MPTVPLMSQLEHYLSLTNKRETVIAANMANVDTPGYRTMDMNFGQEFHRALRNASQEGAETPTHVALQKVPNLVERPDGNNVDMDRESMMLAEVQLQYGLGEQLLKSRFHQLLTAINGGGQ